MGGKDWRNALYDLASKLDMNRKNLESENLKKQHNPVPQVHRFILKVGKHFYFREK